jgi:uncharacterized protein YwqG
MQINLAEVAPFDVAGVLPQSGMLWFFFLMDDESDEFNVSYIRFDAEVGRLERRKAPRDLEKRWRFRANELLPRLEWTVPSPDDCGVDEELVNEHLSLWPDLEDRVAQVQGLEEMRGIAPTHRLLGHPQLIQSPGLAEGTRLLLQVDSDAPRPVRSQYPETGMLWGDCGRVYYLINEQELREHRLAEKPWAMVETC